MKKQKYEKTFDREKKIHRVVKGNKLTKHKKNFYNYNDLSDESHLDYARSKHTK